MVEYIAPAPAVVAALRCAGEPLEDHSPTQASFKTQSRNFGASLTVKTRSSRHGFVAPILSAPLLTDPCRLTVGPGTREDHDAVQVRDLWRTRRVDVPGFGSTLAALDMSSILTLCEQNLGLVDTFLAQELMAQCPDRCVCELIDAYLAFGSTLWSVGCGLCEEVR